jgi:glycosyltransferase involved in cell wall biosynthesis
MSISVVIPLYNKAPHIEHTLQSVLTQTFLPDEIIVVDDGSTDGGGEIVSALGDPRIRLIRQENQGVSAARNRGIQEARGELIAFLDADDTWKPPFLQEILQLRQRYPEAGAYVTAYEVINQDGAPEARPIDVLPPEVKDGLIANYVQAALNCAYVIHTSAVAIPKRIFAEVGGFPVGEKIFEDTDTWLRIGLHYPFAFSKERLVIYHRDATNRTFGFTWVDKEPVISLTGREVIQSGVLSPEALEDLRAYITGYQLRAVHDCLVLGKKDTALEILQHSKGYRKAAKTWWKWRLLALLPGPITGFLWESFQTWKRITNNPLSTLNIKRK